MYFVSVSPVCAYQVIYKKFNIPCPLPVYGNNMTESLIAPVNQTGLMEDDFCLAKFFTINSQVRQSLHHFFDSPFSSVFWVTSYGRGSKTSSWGGISSLNIMSKSEIMNTNVYIVFRFSISCFSPHTITNDQAKQA